MSNRGMKVYGVRRHECSTRQWLTNCREARAGLERALEYKLDDIEDAERAGGNAHARQRVLDRLSGELDRINSEIIALEDEIASVTRDMKVAA